MQVFVGFDGNLEAVPFLEAALLAWEKVRHCDVGVIEIPKGELFEIRRRVLADKLAKEDFYVLADIDAVPEEAYVLSQIHKMIPTRRDFGMAFIRPMFDVGGRVRVIRKGVVEKWPKQTTPSYDMEHAEAIVTQGKQIETWDTIHYRHVPSMIEIPN